MHKTAQLLAFSILILISCTRNPPPDPAPPVLATPVQLIADSVFLYSKEIYLWNTALPDYTTFNPRQYVAADELKTADSVIAKIRTYNTYDNTHGYSYATTYEIGGLNKSGEDIDYGFFVKDAYNISLSGSISFKGWYVSYVYPESDAGLDGVQRGWKINKINNTVLTSSQSTQNLLNDVFVYNKITAASFEFTKPDGTITAAKTYSVKKFTANPVLHAEVINTPTNKKVGYLVFNRFFNGGGAALVNEFSKFQNQGINELILDLRYNGGGVTRTQDTLADLIAPAAENGNLMTKYEYNQQLQNGNFPLLKKKFGWPNNFFSNDNEKNKVYFKKIGSLNLPRIFIIVSDRTASASELLINNLKAVINVQLIGDGSTSGKPVGFFGIDLLDKVTFYTVSFKTTNKNGEGDYYTGFDPRQMGKVMYDGVDRNWGDQTEDCLYGALYYINNGVYPVRSTTTLPRSVMPKLKLAEKNNLMLRD